MFTNIISKVFFNKNKATALGGIVFFSFHTVAYKIYHVRYVQDITTPSEVLS